MSEVRTIQAELMLLSWAETSNGGAKVVFQLADTADLEPFKSLTLAKGKQAGQRFMAVLALVEDDTETRNVGPRCVLIGRWCASERFRAWFYQRYPALFPAGIDPDEARVAEAVRELLAIASRRDIDGDPRVEREFEVAIRGPFSAWLDESARSLDRD